MSGARVGSRTRVIENRQRFPTGRSARAKDWRKWFDGKDSRGVPFGVVPGLACPEGNRCSTWRLGRSPAGRTSTVSHWTHVLSNVSLVEFVLLAALTTFQWVLHRIRGAGWVALSFAILGGLSLALKIDPGLVANQYVAKSVIALLLVMPYCLFRFAATFRTPSLPVRVLAIFVTVAIVAF